MIKSLTSLRFFFAFFVFVSHCRFLQHEAFYNQYLAEGHVGVSFFFMLSGFILSKTYKDKFLNNNISLKKFYILRFARIYPLYLFTLLLTIPDKIELTKTGILQLIMNICMLQSYIPFSNWYFSFNLPSWSLSDEMLFYLIFPFFVVLSNRKLLISFFSLLGTFALLFVLIKSDALIGITHINTAAAKIYESATYNSLHWIYYINPIVRTLDFIFGIVLFNIFSKKQLGSYKYMDVIAVSLFSIFFSFHLSIMKELTYSIYYWIPVALMIYSFSLENGPVSKLLSNKVLIYLGEISFGFYLFHWISIKYTYILIHTYYPQTNLYLIGVFSFITTLIPAMLSYQFIEMPIVKKVRNATK